MLSIVDQITNLKPATRSFAIAALLGATMLANPLTAARADTIANASFQLAQAGPGPQTPAAAAATSAKAETVEQRITSLHSALKITTDEEPKWVAVAQAMRDNATTMEKLVAEAKLVPAEKSTAVEDLKMYQKFSQAHVDGLKNLISSFSTLYSAMPDAQKKIADVVFQTHENGPAKG